MISPEDIREVLAWKASNGSLILSLYIDRKTATGFWNAADLTTLVKGLVKELQPDVDGAERDVLESAGRHALDVLTTGTWSDRSLVAFAEPGGRIWTRELNVPVVSLARWGESPYLLPLLEAFGNHPRLGVALADRERARLFTIFLGEIEEERDAFNPEPVKHVASTGSDQALTMNLQQRAEEHAHLHLKHVTSMLDEMSLKHRFDRLILGGPTEPVNRLRDLLPKRLAESVVGIVHLPVEAAKDEVRGAAIEVERGVGNSRAAEDVETLETAAAKREKATAGLDDTLEALREGRVRTLLYAEGVSLRGRKCSNCGSLFDESAKRCRYCEHATEPVDDLLNEMAGRVAQSGGRIEHVGAAAAERLREIGGIGAFLRF